MIADANIAAAAALMADPTRAAFLTRLLDGRAYTATDLARRARVSPSTASSHLAKLVAGGLAVMERSGRYHYFRLANPTVAHALEAIASVAPAAPVQGLKEAQTGTAIRFARTCYDHLAGRLGVAVTEGLVQAGALTALGTGFEVTPFGVERLATIGVDAEALRRSRRKFAPRCLDWSERRHHVAGALGAALAGAMLERGWLRRSEASRAVYVTEAGRAGLAQFVALPIIGL